IREPAAPDHRGWRARFLPHTPDWKANAHALAHGWNPCAACLRLAPTPAACTRPAADPAVDSLPARSPDGYGRRRARRSQSRDPSVLTPRRISSQCARAQHWLLVDRSNFRHTAARSRLLAARAHRPVDPRPGRGLQSVHLDTILLVHHAGASPRSLSGRLLARHAPFLLEWFPVLVDTSTWISSLRMFGVVTCSLHCTIPVFLTFVNRVLQV